MPSVFTRIVNGELPCHKILENEQYLSFLDIRPLTKGHTLVIPKLEVDYLFDLEDDLLGGLLTFAKPIAKAIEKTIPCNRIGVSVVGLEVPHAHVHLIPINNVSDMSFSRTPLQLDQSELATIAAAIQANL